MATTIAKKMEDEFVSTPRFVNFCKNYLLNNPFINIVEKRREKIE